MKEILIDTLFIDSNDLVLLPVGCPMEQSSDILKLNEQPCCMYNSNKCTYLDSVNYSMKDNRKTLFCKSVE